MRRFASTACVALMLVGVASADEWRGLRGPGARGIAEGEPHPETWSATENVAWVKDLSGTGWSSPIVSRGQVVVTSAVGQGLGEEAKKGLYFGGDRSQIPQSEFRWCVTSLDLATGEVLWETDVHRGVPANPLHIKNTYASETPVTDGERIYAYFGNVGLFCLDFTGEILWQRQWPTVRFRNNWGSAASPVLHGDRIYLINDNEDASFLEAIDNRSGDTIWSIPRDERSNWATPFVWENNLRTEIVVPGTGQNRVYGADGDLLYHFGGSSSITIATPYTAHGLLYVSSGYILDQKKPIFAIRPGAEGDISLAVGETSNPSIAWCQPQAAPYNPSTIVHGDLLYVLLDRGFVACYDARTGEEIYDRQRLPGGEAFTASPWVSDDKLYFLSEFGKTFVVPVGPEFRLIRTNRLRDDDMAMATPAIAEGRLLLRCERRLYCIGEKSTTAERTGLD